ncbi:hypothetical protein A9Q99_02230 [Gammaproteobacteria bacterium 45_16_T64]|nr:hypothetical protein A9Q99_02230 [Gammaproteobacteria bacterium 45_16_T64]
MNTNIKPGFLLYRRKGFVEHAGVYLGRNQVLHNSPSGDVEIISFVEYADGKVVKVIETGEHDNAVLVQRLTVILQDSGQYHVSANNCEHIANLLIYGRRSSPQIQASVTGMIVGGLAGLNMGRGNPFLMVFIGGLVGGALSNALRKYDGKTHAVDGYLV